MPELNNKKLVKNAAFLTVRMLVVSIVGLYTSRVVLQALGVEDYGLYGLVGGIVGMVTFLNGAMGGATSRFITYEIGAGNSLNLQKIFSTSFIIHSIIACIAVVVVEVIGYWFIYHKLVIPEDRLFAANIVFQLSVLTMAINFTQVPYSAMIIAHEKMDIYAYYEIVNVVCRLIMVYLLLLTTSDRLILYAISIFILSIGGIIFYRWYCRTHFKESRLRLKIDKPFAKKMLSFSGFDLYGNMSVMVYLQSLPILINIFFGVVANAAANIGLTVTGAIKGFSWAVSAAFSPQITKQYAAGQIENMGMVMCRSIMFTVLIFGMLALPFILETERVLYLWLKQVPEYSVVFLRCIMLVTIVDYVTISNNRGIHATGNIKGLSITSGSFYLICPLISYLLLKVGAPAYIPYLINASMLTVVSCIGFYLLKRQIPTFNIKAYIHVICMSFLIIGFSLFILRLFKVLYLDKYFIIDYSDFWPSIIVVALMELLSICILGLLSWFIIMNHYDREVVRNKLKTCFLRLRK
ncbi:polysaccharide biosynthesis protein [uncultured Muribaculum sp.]|uniref:polysaccharide biosynthesis protein n=1 Tax=uncultured Muribaculum sp. TaxID=1918613 RepID=UPI0025AE3A34|nr:polysaccharide biosynthesis protein [uncultured Muribaculum sp.]